MADHTELLQRIIDRAQRDHSLVAPISEADVAAAEQRLGFRLHPLLAAVYRHVGDGGFGPGYQLLSLLGSDGGDSAAGTYLALRSSNAGTDWAWPEGVLPILTWGCGMYACVDCRSDEGTVLLFEPNPGDPDVAWYVDTPNLAVWFEHYLNDTGWWIKAEQGEDVDDMQPWPNARQRAQ